MIKLVVREAKIIKDIDDVWQTIKMRKWRNSWDATLGRELGMSMRLEVVDDCIRAFLEFETEEEAALFRLTYL